MADLKRSPENERVAAGFGPLPESLMAWVLIAGAYIATVCVSFALRRQGLSSAARVTSAAPFVAVSLPPLLLVTAVLVEGSYWSDWHFWQLYLIGSTMLTGCYVGAMLAWRFVTAIKEGRTSRSSQRAT